MNLKLKKIIKITCVVCLFITLIIIPTTLVFIAIKQTKKNKNYELDKNESQPNNFAYDWLVEYKNYKINNNTLISEKFNDLFKQIWTDFVTTQNKLIKEFNDFLYENGKKKFWKENKFYNDKDKQNFVHNFTIEFNNNFFDLDGNKTNLNDYKLDFAFDKFVIGYENKNLKIYKIKNTNLVKQNWETLFFNFFTNYDNFKFKNKNIMNKVAQEEINKIILNQIIEIKKNKFWHFT